MSIKTEYIGVAAAAAASSSLEVFYLLYTLGVYSYSLSFVFYRPPLPQKRWKILFLVIDNLYQQHPGGQTGSRAFPQSRSYIYVHIAAYNVFSLQQCVGPVHSSSTVYLRNDPTQVKWATT